MTSKRSIKRASAALVTSVAVGAAMLVSTATQASASTIKLGWLQLCAQGSYSAFVHVLSEPIPGTDESTKSYHTNPEPPGQCTWFAADTKGVGTKGVWVQVDVVGVHSDGSEFYIGSEWYNSTVSGLGIGAKGSQSSPYLETW